jgi:hypothetical protein
LCRCDIAESDESRQQQLPEEVFHKLMNLLGQTVASRVSPARPRLIFIDALDYSAALTSMP